MAQQQEELAGDKQELTGEIDCSFAGELMPTVNVTDPDGAELNLGALQGQPVLMNLWATWCAPCVVEMPMLDELAELKAGELRVLTVSQDMRGAEAVVPFFEDRDFTHLEPWLDPANDLGVSFGGSGAMPLTVLYSAEGQELFRVAGGYHWNSEEAIAAIDDALASAD
ncbi:MAG: TlpA family protein disulfide reductase [Altererythrobacter sp.]|nr:TlpA family protein disulfide reductase [Altererythrobacter sp.]NNK45161.1 TlpA family protein disulfide reductase [Altererythrobacter sp.]